MVFPLYFFYCFFYYVYINLFYGFDADKCILIYTHKHIIYYMWYAWCNLTWHIKAAPGKNMLNGVIVDAMTETDLVWRYQRVRGRQTLRAVLFISCWLLLTGDYGGIPHVLFFLYFVFCLNLQNIWNLFSLILHIHPVKIPRKVFGVWLDRHFAQFAQHI